jgi:hypothetical protein
MSSRSGTAGAIDRGAGGLVGILIVKAIASAHFCPTHGKIPASALPPEHRRIILFRRLALLGVAGSVLLLVVGLVVAANMMGS